MEFKDICEDRRVVEIAIQDGHSASREAVRESMRDRSAPTKSRFCAERATSSAAKSIAGDRHVIAHGHDIASLVWKIHVAKSRLVVAGDGSCADPQMHRQVCRHLQRTTKEKNVM